jgi:hypothetical protein
MISLAQGQGSEISELCYSWSFHFENNTNSTLKQPMIIIKKILMNAESNDQQTC